MSPSEPNERALRPFWQWTSPYCVDVFAATLLLHLSAMALASNYHLYLFRETWLTMVMPSYFLLYLMALPNRRTESRGTLYGMSLLLFLYVYGMQPTFSYCHI